LTNRQAQADILIHANTDCLDNKKLATSLEALVNQHPRSTSLKVSVVDAKSLDDGFVVTLRVLNVKNGIELLKREFRLSPTDCSSADKLLSLVLERFLKELPTTTKAEILPNIEKKAVVDRVVVTREVVKLASRVFLAADSRWFPFGQDMEIGWGLGIGNSHHRFITTVALRIAKPRSLGQGNYIESQGLIGIGWSYSDDNWLFRAQFRVGPLLVWGYGFQENAQTWMPALEIQSSFQWNLGKISVGPQLGISIIQNKVTTSGGVEERLPLARLGLIVGYTF
jgi:hypothetical protein